MKHHDTRRKAQKKIPGTNEERKKQGTPVLWREKKKRARAGHI